MAALEIHAKAFNNCPNAPTQVQILANDLAVERNAALAAQEALVAQQVQHQGRLLAANRGMGLVPPSLVKAFRPRPISIMRSIATKN